jgi:phosphatidylserine/phosphatidylglycerophosphate/cardiolipin synthase-like enzyme
MSFTWPPDNETLMWLQIGTGFFGALTLMHWLRLLARRFGRVFSMGVFFSPKGGCENALLAELNKARREILVQAYSFTAGPLAQGLVEAKKRGVNVEVILDKSNEVERFTDLNILLDNGLHPLIDSEHAIAHNKVMIIDQKIVITGSFNFTNQAENQNAENMLIIKGHPEMVSKYRSNFQVHKQHSKPAVKNTEVGKPQDPKAHDQRRAA